ncbi:hypothetical protein [Umezakia ovalisporum]|jgi:pyruvate/2-oxoglutarate dehydrogenase complex dihydrolipoamide dehydrogenase (E3) component
MPTRRVLVIHIIGDNFAVIIQGAVMEVKMAAKKQEFDTTVGIHP